MRYLLLSFTCFFLLISSALSIASAADSISKKRIKLETTEGNIVLELDITRAPLSVLNFMNYVRSGFYDGTIFHRVIKDFMIQGGGFTSVMKEKTTRKPVKNEADNGLKNIRGTVAMARTSDPHSATAQFFINTADNNFLDHKNKSEQGWGYAVFGKVVEGIEAVNAVSAVKTTTRGPHQDVPTDPVVIKRASKIE
jgi:peptidyl-prolyl cis-trans isomerase B (cyclophilin B)